MKSQLQKYLFLVLSVRKNQSKCQNTALLLVNVQIWIDFYVHSQREEETIEHVSSLISEDK